MVCTAALAVSAAGAVVPPQPNVLFIAADDLRTELGCYGDPEALTPNIDALARRGRIFQRAYCQQAVCNPSRASLLTGLRPDTLRVWDLATHVRSTTPDVVTLPQHFKNLGYYTRDIGKIFHNDTRPASAGERMFDAPSWSVTPTHATGEHWRDWVVPGEPAGPRTKQGATQCLDAPDDAYFDGQIATEAIASLRAQKEAEQPFFLAVGFWKPHLPFNAPKKYWDLYDRAKLSPPLNPHAPTGAPPIALHGSIELRNYAGIPRDGPLSPEKIMELRHGYLACVSFLDAQVGRLLAELDRLSLRENTIVVLWGDNGFHLGEHDLWGKTSNYELDAHVPLIISVPGAPAPGEPSHALVELLDVYPTLVELCGLPAVDGLEGVSLVPLLHDPHAAGKAAVLTQHPHPFYGEKSTTMGYALRTERYRYVEWRDLGNDAVVARELYDEAADPLETVNRAADPARRSSLESLAQTLNLLRRRQPTEDSRR